MEVTHCKNCNTSFQGNFCNSCGQRAIGNSRLKMTVVIQDFFDNTFNLHKGFFFTLWHLLLRPGNVAQSYIDGKRKRYTNPTRFMVIGLAFQAFIDYWFETTEVIKQEQYYYFAFLSESMNTSMEIWNVKLAVEYILLTNLFMIVLLPATLYVLFKPLHYNFTELLSSSFYFFPTILFLTMPLLFITKVLMGIYVSKEVIIFIYTAYLFWAYLSFFNRMRVHIRVIRFFLAYTILMSLRVFFLPWILSLIYLQTP